jgi:hypothetical protein
MVNRLVARYRRDPHTGAVLSHSPGRRSGTRFLGERLEQIVAQAIKTFLLIPKRPSATAPHRAVSSECKKAGLSAPSYNAIREWMKFVDLKESSITVSVPRLLVINSGRFRATAWVLHDRWRYSRLNTPRSTSLSFSKVLASPGKTPDAVPAAIRRGPRDTAIGLSCLRKRPLLNSPPDRKRRGALSQGW